MNWQQRGDKPSESSPLVMPEPIWHLLYGRGLTSGEQIERHLSPKLKDLKDPFSLTDMQTAIDRLVFALEHQECICIYGDYDMDGTSGMALLKDGLAKLGYSHLLHYQPSRLSEGYGLHATAVEKIKALGADLIVTVDVGITATEAALKASQIGIDLIITDHHLPEENLPKARAIVNPNRQDDESGLGHLCGTGVAFFLILALRKTLAEKDLLAMDFDPKNLLDCFVIGTLTDMVPLVDENRILVKHGLIQLAKSTRPGLQGLLHRLNLSGKDLTSSDVAIRYAPKLNALSRMESGLLPADLFFAGDDDAEQLLDQVETNNQKRLALQKRAENKAFASMRDSPQNNAIWLWSGDFHKGVVGLVATKLCQKFGLPSFVGSLNEEGKIVGSARSPSTKHSVLGALKTCSEVLSKFGGHEMAAGFELSITQAEDFGQRLSSHFSDLGPGQEPPIVFDAEARLQDFDPTFMNWYRHLEPFGTDFATPSFLIKRVRITEVRKMRGGHLRLSLLQPPNTRRQGVWFSPPPDHPIIEKSDADIGCLANVLVEPQWNYFNGRKSLQLLVKDLRLL